MIKDIIEQRNITRLFHFTRATNLASIFKYEILPRNELDKRGIHYSWNDDTRLDRCLNAVCTSIEFPNYKMFYSLICKNPNVDWAVIEIDIRVVLDFDCAYCWTNAGDSTEFRKTIEERTGEKAFLSLFEEREGYPKRYELDIDDRYPTNPQAEVLVFSDIPISYIRKIYFKKSDIMRKYNDSIPDGIPRYVNQNVFAPRSDYLFW